MKIKMVKMGSDYTTPINCRLRGIVVTSDNKHLSVEIGCAYSPDIRHTSLTQKEYNIKYPNPQYVSIDSCYRVDIPEDRYKNSTKEYSKYIRANFFEIPYTEKGIIEFLKKLNNDIDGIELVNEYYIDKYCEENGFYELYDDRLKHNYEILSIKYLDPDIKGKSKITYKYTCYAKDGTEFSEIGEERDNIKNIVKSINERKPDIVVFTGDLINSNNNLSDTDINNLTNISVKKSTCSPRQTRIIAWSANFL